MANRKCLAVSKELERWVKPSAPSAIYHFRFTVYYSEASKWTAKCAKIFSRQTNFCRGRKMKFRKLVCAVILALFSLQTINFSALADEGMWTFNNVPRAEIKKKYGFDITDEWLKKVQLASVRFNNDGAGRFVSPHPIGLGHFDISDKHVFGGSSIPN